MLRGQNKNLINYNILFYLKVFLTWEQFPNKYYIIYDNYLIINLLYTSVKNNVLMNR